MLYRHDFASASTRSWPLPGHTIGSLAVRASGGLILAMDQGLYMFDPESGDLESIAQPLAGKDGLRLNYGKVDPFGYFVTGAMNIHFRQNLTGSMYRLSPDLELTEVLDGFSCFNGPCFSANGDRLYLTGRDECAIEVFDYGCNELPTNGQVLLANCAIPMVPPWTPRGACGVHSGTMPVSFEYRPMAKSTGASNFRGRWSVASSSAGRNST